MSLLLLFPHRRSPVTAGPGMLLKEPKSKPLNTAGQTLEEELRIELQGSPQAPILEGEIAETLYAPQQSPILKGKK